MDIRSTRNRTAARLAKLREEARVVEKELEELDQLIALATKYGVTEFGPEPTSAIAARVAGQLAIPLEKTLRDRVLDTAEEVLADGVRRLSRELLPELAARGVVLRGNKPVPNLAAYLSKAADRFTSNVKAGGWTLTRLTQKKGRPDDVGASSGRCSNAVSH